MLLYACAKEGYPTGGPKDETPPTVLGVTPANGTLNFNVGEFVIAFDEYVQIKDADNNILVSPPMKQKNEYGTKGRSVVAKIKDTLRENTTYLFQFKNAIVDFNEGNPLKSFEYVFSTGGGIDSMAVCGQVLDALSCKPSQEVVTVAAYSMRSAVADTFPASDSVVAKEHPTYLTRCDKEGYFQLNHMREGSYLLIAFEDADKNLRLSAGEPVAFLDSLVVAQKMIRPLDTAAQDTAVPDSSLSDSTALPSPSPAPSRSLAQADSLRRLQLRLSLYKQEQQRLAKSGFKRRGQVEVVSQLPLTDTFAIFPLDGRRGDTTLYIKLNRRRDTLSIWPAREDCDSLVWVVSDHQLSDTLRLQYRDKALSGKRPQPGRPTSWLKSLVAASHPYFDTLWIGFETPVAELAGIAASSDSVVKVFSLSDSTTSYCGLRLQHDLYPAASSLARLDFVGKPGEKYRFVVPQGIFKNIYGHTNNDSLVVTTQLTSASDYGNITLTVVREGAAPADSALSVAAAGTPAATLDETPLLIQLVDEKGSILRQQVVAGEGRVTFANLKGAKYSLQAVVDSDRDGKWTPGDYWAHRQPERVILFPKTLELRENWNMEEKWLLHN